MPEQCPGIRDEENRQGDPAIGALAPIANWLCKCSRRNRCDSGLCLNLSSLVKLIEGIKWQDVYEKRHGAVHSRAC